MHPALTFSIGMGLRHFSFLENTARIRSEFGINDRTAGTLSGRSDSPRIRGSTTSPSGSILGGSGQKEGVGLNEYGIIVIDTDGKITRK